MSSYYYALSDVDRDAYESFAKITERNGANQPKEDKKEENMKQASRIIIIISMMVLLFIVPSLTVAQNSATATVEPSPLTPLPQGEGELVTSEPPVEQPPVVVVHDDGQFSPTQWVLVAVIGVLALLLGTQGRTIIQPAILELSKNISPAALEVILAAGRAGIDQAGKFVEGTETKIDDAAFDELKRGYEQLEKEIREIKAIAYRAADRPPDGLT